MRDRGDFFAGLVIGGLAGILAGVLFAPKEGSATRHAIGTTVGDVSERVRRSTTGVTQRVTSQNVLQVVQHLRDRVKDVFDGLDAAIEEAANTVDTDDTANAELPGGQA